MDCLEQPHVRELLSRLAAGKLSLSHQALDAWSRLQAIKYMSNLLMSCGGVPGRLAEAGKSCGCSYAVLARPGAAEAHELPGAGRPRVRSSLFQTRAGQ